MISVHTEEHPVAIQLFGGDIESLVQAAEFVDQILMLILLTLIWCPVNKVVKERWRTLFKRSR